MIHIFESWSEDLFEEEKFQTLSEDFPLKDRVQKYIFYQMMNVMDKMQPEDMAVIEYLYLLYCSVISNPSIAAENRSLSDMLKVMEMDLKSGREDFRKIATFVLFFLEADIVNKMNLNKEHLQEQRLLGQIETIRYRWLTNPGKKDAKEEPCLRPSEIKNYLDDYVICQTQAKKIISTAVYGHMKRIQNPEIPMAGSVVLLIGPSGCGKTEIMRRIRELTKLPMVFTDVSSLGASQFRGRHKEDVLLELWNEAGRDLKKAETGIIFMDEFDKLLRPAFSERGVDMHDDVQSQLLTMLEGSDVELKAEGSSFTMNTSNILFVLAGAFQGIEEYIKADKTKKEHIAGSIGFLSTPSKELDFTLVREHINHDVLMQYGMKRELAGRISSIAVLEKLSRESILQIMTGTKDSILERYEREFEVGCHARLVFAEDALELIADRIMEEETGARALYSVFREILRDSLYEFPGRTDIREIHVDADVVRGQKKPELIYA